MPSGFAFFLWASLSCPRSCPDTFCGGRLFPHAPRLPSGASASTQHGGGTPRAPHVTARRTPPPFPACPAPPPDPGSAAGPAPCGPSRARHGGPGLLPLAQPQVSLHHRQLRRGEGEPAALGLRGAESPLCPPGLPRGFSKAGRWTGALFGFGSSVV